jgi:hypothetical protein
MLPTPNIKSETTLRVIGGHIAIKKWPQIFNRDQERPPSEELIFSSINFAA